MNPDLTLRTAMPTTPPRRGGEAAAPAPALAIPAAVAPDVPLQPNLKLRLDPALGIVVMEFRGTPGMPARSLPTENELAAYRIAAITGTPRPSEVALPTPRGANFETAT